MNPERGFPRKEYEARLNKIQTSMAADNIDVLLLTQEHDIRYVTGFMTPFWQSPTRPWFVVVPKAGLPEAVIPSIGHDAMARGFVGSLHLFASPSPMADGIETLAHVIRDQGGTAPSIGMMMGAGTKLMMPLKDLEYLKDAIGTPKIVDATAILRDARMLKSPLEVAKIRHICGLASTVFDGLPAWVAQGQGVRSIFAQFKIKALQNGIDDVPYLVGAAGQGGYGDIISPPPEDAIRSGDVLMLDTGCVWDGYFCDFDRNYGFGEVAAEALEAYDLLWQATEDGLQQLRPGMTAAELFGIMQKRLGGSDDSVGRYGHGLGIQLTEPPSHIDWDDTILQTGMVLTLEPSLALSGGKMMVHEENILLTEQGAELLTSRAAKRMPIIPASGF